MSETIAMAGGNAASGSKLKTAGIYSLYALFFIAALVTSLVWTFPNRQLKTFVEGQARKAGVPLSIGEMELRGIGGVTLKDVRVVVPPPKRKPAKRGQEPPPPAEPMIVNIDELNASVGVFAAIGGNYNVDFDMKVGDGIVEGGVVKAKKGSKAIDVSVEKIDALPLADLGVGRRIVESAPKMRGELDGLLNGDLKVHWGGNYEDFTGAIDLELVDAVIRQPELDLQGGLKLADLRMGVLTLKVKIDKKKKIKVLSGRKGSDKATAISLEGVDMFGKDVELVVEERSHVLIPPGKAGMRAASLWVHFAFALPQPKKAKKGKDGKEDAGDGRLKWSDVMKFAGNKLKPFERNGYIGMTCSGSARRPNCKPALPQVTVGTRRKARSEARKAKKEGKPEKKVEEKKPEPKKAAETKPDKAAEKKPDERKDKPDKAKITAKPVPRPGATTGKIAPRKTGKGAKVKRPGDDEDDEDEDDEDREDEDREDEDREDEEEDEDDEGDDEDGPRKKKAKKGAKKGGKDAAKAKSGKPKKKRDDDELDEEDDE